MSNSDPTNKTPPISGQWKPGQSGNPEGGRRHKKYKQAVQIALAKLASDGEMMTSLVEIAAAEVARAKQGDPVATQHIANRIDGKVPMQIGQDPESGPLLVRWLKPGEDE